MDSFQNTNTLNPWPLKEEQASVYPSYLKKYIDRYKVRKRASKAIKNSKEIYEDKPIYKAPDYMKKYLVKYLGKNSGVSGRKLNFDKFNEPIQKKHGRRSANAAYAITLNAKEKLWKLIRYFAKKEDKPISTFCLEIITRDLVVRMHHEKRNRKNIA